MSSSATRWSARKTRTKKNQAEGRFFSEQFQANIADSCVSSLHAEIEPLMMIMGWDLDNICIRVRSENIQGAVSFIRTTLKDLLPNYTFEYEFLDTRLANRYIAEQRTKEIGIRKVLGSSVAGILVLLSKEFVKWVLMAHLIA